MRKPQDRSRDVVGTGELKAVAQALITLGTRVLHRSRVWLTDRRNEMRQPTDRSHRYQAPADRSSGEHRTAGDRRTQRDDERESWMHDKERQAARTGRADYAYDPGRGGASGYENNRYDERAAAPPRRGSDAEDRYADSDWHATDFDERSQTVGWQGRDDEREGGYAGSRRDSDRMRERSDPGQGYYAYSGENASRDWRHRQDRYDQRRGGYAEPQSLYQGRRPGEEDEYRASGVEARRAAHDADVGSGERYARSGYREQGAPSYRGHGPRNYARSDERIAEDLNERLTEDDLIDASDIEVRCSEGKIVLEGEVSVRWMKHRAEDIAEACSGVKDVDNRIRVRSGGHAILTAGPESDGRNTGSDKAASASTGSRAAHSPSGSGTGPTSTSPGTSSGTGNGPAQAH